MRGHVSKNEDADRPVERDRDDDQRAQVQPKRQEARRDGFAQRDAAAEASDPGHQHDGDNEGERAQEHTAIEQDVNASGNAQPEEAQQDKDTSARRRSKSHTRSHELGQHLTSASDGAGNG